MQMVSLKKIAALSLIAAAAASLPASASFAEPSRPKLPNDWIPGAPGLKEPVAEKTKDVDQATLDFRKRMSRVRKARSVDIDALPVISIQKPRPAGEIPSKLPSATAADVVVLSNGGARRINVVGFEAGVIFINQSVGFFGLAGVGGISSACGPGAFGNPVRPIRYEAVRRVDKEGSLEFVMGRGFIETATCRVAIEERWSVRPAKMAGGLILGFRTRCDTCDEGSRDALHVVTPQMNDGFDRVVPLEHHAFSLEKGASKILRGFTVARDLLSFKVPDWSDFSDRMCQKPETRCSHGVRIEVSRTDSEARATVLVSPDISDP